MNELSKAQRLRGKNVVIIGGSRGLGKTIVAATHAEGARVLAVARREQSLRQLAAEIPGVRVLALDAADEGAPAQVFETLLPDILVVCAGALPHMAPLVEQSWEQFSRNWNSDVKMSLLFSQAALTTPLPAGTTIMLISSGAVFHTYSCYSRGIDMMNATYQYLDLTPRGRDEDGPEGPLAWVRHHDRY